MSSVGGGSFTIEFSGPTSGVIYTDPNFVNTNAIGGCNMDFGDSESRGYVYKSNDPKNVELKFIMSTDLPGGFSVSQTAGRHSGSGCCSGFAYMINMECDTNPVTFRFRKEMWHVSYHTDPKTGDFTHPDFNFKLNDHGNIGICFIKYLKKDGISSGHDSVVLEFRACADPDDNPDKWVLIKKTEDKGGWGNDGDDCGGNKDQVGAWGMPKFRLKSNSNGSITFKHLSVREIDPLNDFDNTPDNPDTNPPVDQPATNSTVLGTFKLQRDINVQRSNPCAATGDKAFYDWIGGDVSAHDLVNASVSNFIQRLGERCTNTSSSLYQKTPSKFDVKLCSVGSPAASPTVNATIRTSDNALKYTSPTTVDPTTLTGSLAVRTFDFSTNTYTMQTGDKICVEYAGTDGSNYVQAGVRQNDDLTQADGTNSTLTYFNGS